MIEISEHAKKAMLDDGITEEEIKECLDCGELEIKQVVKGEMRYGKKLESKDKIFMVTESIRLPVKSLFAFYFELPYSVRKETVLIFGAGLLQPGLFDIAINEMGNSCLDLHSSDAPSQLQILLLYLFDSDLFDELTFIYPVICFEQQLNMMVYKQIEFLPFGVFTSRSLRFRTPI